MPPLTAEERAQLEQQLPNFGSSPILQHLAERKLLPQQNEIPSFESPDVLTQLRRSIFGHTKKEQQLIKRQDEILAPFLQEQKIRAGLEAASAMEQAKAPPSFESAQQQNPLAYALSGIQPPTGRNVFPGLPPTQISALEQAGVPSHILPGQDVVTSEYPRIRAPLSAAQGQAYLQGVEQVPGVQAKGISGPPDYSKDLEAFTYAKSAEELGRPMSFRELVALDPKKAVEYEKTVRESRPLERAINIGVAAAERQQAAPLPQGERKNLFSRKDFLQGNLTRLPPGISKGAAARADVVEISDKQLEDLRNMENSALTVRTLFDLADEIITAEMPSMAIIKQGPSLLAGALSGSNPAAAAYRADKDAFTSTTARQVGQEKGVLTDQDVARWSRTLPGFFDTVAVKEAKRRIFNKILGGVMEGNRRIIAGDSPKDVKAEALKKLNPLLKEAERFLPEIATDEEYKKLPSGTEFIAPDGSHRRKP